MTAPYIPPDPHAVAIRRALASLSMPNVMPDMTRVASQAPPVQQQPTIGAAPAAPQYAQPVGGVLGALLSAGQSTDRMLHNFREHPMQSLANLTGVPQVAQGIREGSPGSIAGGLLAAAAPFFGFPEERLASEAAGVGASDAMRNMAATGFAFPKSGAMVELPAGGAGRVGSTATAMAHALRTTSPDNFQQLVLAEIARRGGASSPEVEMAATEEVARRLASQEPATMVNRFLRHGAEVADSVAARSVTLPPPPGTASIPDGHVRLYHQTGEENAAGIAREGLRVSHARGIEGPKAIYASERGFYGKPGDVPTVEFHVPKAQWDDPFVLTDHVPPQSIVGVHLPWHTTARYIEAEPDAIRSALNGEYDDLLNERREGPAVRYIKAKYGMRP